MKPPEVLARDRLLGAYEVSRLARYSCTFALSLASENYILFNRQASVLRCYMWRSIRVVRLEVLANIVRFALYPTSLSFLVWLSTLL